MSLARSAEEADAPGNMQWLTRADAKAKDKTEARDSDLGESPLSSLLESGGIRVTLQACRLVAFTDTILACVLLLREWLGCGHLDDPSLPSRSSLWPAGSSRKSTR
jgi:hypothetical protein